MIRNTIPTNDLIIHTAELYVSLLAELQITAVIYSAAGANRRPAVVATEATCRAVEHAARYWDEAITTPLLDAHAAMHRLAEVSLDRARIDHEPNSPFSIIARREVKRLHRVVTEANAEIRCEIVKTEAQIRAAVSDVLQFLRD